MNRSQLPAETIQQIFADIGDDKQANFKAGTLSKDWLRQQRYILFDGGWSFKDEKDVVKFAGLTASPACTFPLRFACDELSFGGLAAMANEGALAMRVVASRFTTPRSLTLDIAEGKIPRPIIRAMKSWRSNLHRLKISGGTHNPRTLFPAISSLPHLEDLELQDFNFKQKKNSVVAQGCLVHLPQDTQDALSYWRCRPFQVPSTACGPQRRAQQLRCGVYIEVHLPRSPGLWGEKDPVAQLEQLLEEMHGAHLPAKHRREVPLVVKGFPADLPERFKTITLCGTPVTFIDGGVYE